MEQMQFTAIVLMTFLTLKLLLLPDKAAVNIPVNRARWLLTCGTFVLGVQFLLQYLLGLRNMGVTQAVMLNLTLFIPASVLMSLGILRLQQKERLTRWDKYVGVATWVVVMTLLTGAAASDGQPLLSDTPELRWAEVISSVFYAVMQGYYTWRLLSNLRNIRDTLQNYYDYNTTGLLRWMRYSVAILVIMALMVPLIIFFHSPLLAGCTILFLGGVFYLVDSFCLYALSSVPREIQEAEGNKETLELHIPRGHTTSSTTSTVDMQQAAAPLLNRPTMLRVGQAVEQWLQKGGYLKGGMKLPMAAEEIGIPQYQLSAWLRQQDLKYSEWINSLRVDEAKRVIREHPNWCSEAIAQHCGFNDRSYFQKKFKEKEGISPAEYQSSLMSD